MLVGTPVRAETYIAGMVGIHVPNNLSDIDLDCGCKSTDEKLQTSVMYGAKVGHYFDSMRWLGIETEIFNATPHKKQQEVTITQAGQAPVVTTDSSLLRVTTVALNILARYPGERLQPYVGIGPGVFFARAQENATSQYSTSVGLNALAGLRVIVTQHVSIFGEWKYNYTRLDFPAAGALLGYSANYSANMLAFGVGYHF